MDITWRIKGNQMPKDFMQRRMEQLRKGPDIYITANIAGYLQADGMLLWEVEVDGESDCILAAGILERAAAVLRQPDE